MTTATPSPATLDEYRAFARDRHAEMTDWQARVQHFSATVPRALGDRLAAAIEAVAPHDGPSYVGGEALIAHLLHLGLDAYEREGRTA
jgi:hypothetical protein